MCGLVDKRLKKGYQFVMVGGTKLGRGGCGLSAIALIILSWLFLNPSLGADKPPFTLQELAKLERGEVVLKHVETKTSDTEQLSRLVASVLIRRPPEVLWEVLDHPEREKDWIPYVKQSAVVSDLRPTPTTRVNITDYRVAAFGMEVYYSLVREYDYKAKTIVAHMDKGRPHKYFVDIHSWWNFFDHKDGIIFQYSSDSQLTLNMPKLLSDSLAEKQLAMGVGAIRKRCDFIAEEMKRRQPSPGAHP